MHWFLKEGNNSGKPDAKRLGINWKSTHACQASFREKKEPPLGKVQVKHRHPRSPHAMKFEDLSHEETERQQRCARCKACNPVKNMHKLKEKDHIVFHSSVEECVLPASSTKEPQEREFAKVSIVSK